MLITPSLSRNAIPPVGDVPLGNFPSSRSTTAPFMEGAISNRSSLFAFHASFEVQQLLGVSMETNTVVPLIGALGLVSLAISWHLRESSSVRLAQIGWILVGIYFFVGAWNYQAKGDLILQ